MRESLVWACPFQSLGRDFLCALLSCMALWLSGCDGNSVDPSTLCEATALGVSASSSDNTAAFQAALNACAGRTMHVAAGTYVFAPALAFPNTHGYGNGIIIPDGTSIVGDGPAATILQIEGPGNYAYFFWIRDVSNVSIKRITLAGNNARDPPPPEGEPPCYYDYGHAIFVQATTQPVGNIAITENKLIGFTGSSWITLLGGENGNGIGQNGDSVVIDHNHFLSVDGNAIAPQLIYCAASAISIQGLGPVASASGIEVTDNIVEAEFIKTGVAVWSGAANILIKGNTIENAGMGLPVPNGYSNGSYAILVYHQHAIPPDTSLYVPPTGIDIIDNIVDSPYSSGVYVADGRNVNIEGNRISGQVDTYDVTEPRGAIALNGLNNSYGSASSVVSNNAIHRSAIGISIALGVLPTMDSNTVDSIVPGGVGIKINGTKADGLSLTLTNTHVAADAGASGVSSVVGFFKLDNLVIDGLYQTGATYTLRWFRDVVGTPSQSPMAYCDFDAFGSIGSVFVGAPSCGELGCFVRQSAFWTPTPGQCAESEG